MMTIYFARSSKLFLKRVKRKWSWLSSATPQTRSNDLGISTQYSCDPITAHPITGNVQKLRFYCSNHLNNELLISKHWTFGCFFVQFLNDFITWLGRPFKNRIFLATKQTFLSGFQITIKKPDHLTTVTCLDHLNTRFVWYLDGYCILIIHCRAKSGIQMVTVFW